jgi:hypothetical protein
VERRHQGADRAVRVQVAAHIAWLAQALSEGDEELDQRLRASPLWRRCPASLASARWSLEPFWPLPELGPGSVSRHLAP